jgi:membrane protease YdiL (CAAX protease family)
MASPRQRLATYAGLFVALGSPFVLQLLLTRPEDVTSRLIHTIAQQWAIVAVLLFIVFRWERQSLASIGMRRPSTGDVLWALAAFVLGAFVFIVTAPVVKALNLTTTSEGIARLAQVPIELRIATVFTAAITEEILFRGFPIERLNTLTGGRLVLSAAIAYAVFVALHIPFWGLGGALQIALWSLVVTALYVKRRNLPACILMHGLNDAYAFILLPFLFAQGIPQ